MNARVLLIWPDSLNEVLGWGDLGAIAEPLALEYLGSALRAAGHEARILDLRLRRDDLARTLAEYRPHLVGVTAFSMHVSRAIGICTEVKAFDPAIATIVGGHHATFLPDDFFKDAVDLVVSGDGTEAIVAAAAEAAGGAPAYGDGVHRHDPNGRFTVTGARTRLLSRAELDELPVPDRSLTEADRARYFIDWMRPIALLRTSVGCPYRCSFCSVWRVFEGHYHLRSIDRVVAELLAVEEENVFLIDDEAFINGKRMLALADAIRAAGIEKHYFTYCRIDTLLRNRDAVAAWRDIGLSRLFIGIDAISWKDLDEYNKKCSIDEIERGLEVARELGVGVFAQFVVNTDYRPDDFKTLERFIERSGVEYPSFTVLTPLPGTEMLANFDSVTERQENGRPNWDLFDCQNAVTETRLPRADFRMRYRNLYRVFKGAYSQYREHVVAVHEDLAEGDALSRPVSQTVRLGAEQMDKASVL
ncbi:radical SAM protein [soil metagenome]